MADTDTEEEGVHAPVGRASWKGYLKLSLVTCAVALYPAATASEKVSFATVNRASGERIRRRYVDASTGAPVDPDEQIRGYEVGKDRYVQVEGDELDALRIESTQTIDIDRFVPLGEVDPVYVGGAHYLVPDDPVAVEAYAVIREAMRREKVAGLGAVVLNRRERMLLLTPRGKGILASSLRYPYEVRSDESAFAGLRDARPDPEAARLVDRLIDSRRGRFPGTEIADRWQQDVTQLIRAKTAGKRPPRAQEQQAPPDNVVNLMDALRRSIAEEKEQTRVARPAAGKAGGAKPADSKPARGNQGRKPRGKG